MDSAADADSARGRLVLSASERHTFRRHLGFTVLDAAVAGILANALLMASKALGAQDWHLNVPLGLSCVGMIAALYLGAVMAQRPKKPFVVLPGLGYAAASLAMAVAQTPWLFLLIYGMGAVFEVATRPAITAVVRANYAPEHRNHAMGRLRQAAALVFLVFTLGSAWLLDHAGCHAVTLIHGQMALAGLLSLGACLCFQGIRVAEPSPSPSPIVTTRQPWLTTGGELLASGVTLVRQDRRFGVYLLSFAGFAFFNLLYATSVTTAFLSKDLSLGYLGCTLLIHVIPSVASFLLTGRLGAWIDRAGPWRSWALIRVFWGLDPLLLVLAGVTPGFAAVSIAAAARISRGSVMGGSWILSWQTGVSYFAPPGGDTARYMGVATFVNGLLRLAAALASSALLAGVPRWGVLLIGGLGVLLSAGHALRCQRQGWVREPQSPHTRSQTADM